MFGKQSMKWANTPSYLGSLGQPSHRTRPGHGALMMSTNKPVDMSFTPEYMGGSTEIDGYELEEIADQANDATE
jgi:hypothetical protein